MGFDFSNQQAQNQNEGDDKDHIGGGSQDLFMFAQPESRRTNRAQSPVQNEGRKSLMQESNSKASGTEAILRKQSTRQNLWELSDEEDVGSPL